MKRRLLLSFGLLGRWPRRWTPGWEGEAGRSSGGTEKYATQCCTLAKLHFQFVSGQAQRRKQGTSKWPTRREKKIYIKDKMNRQTRGRD